MLSLAGTSALLRVVTTGTADLHVHESHTDFTAGTPDVYTPSSDNVQITTATTTTIVPSPTGTTIRNIRTVMIRNAHASASQGVTLEHTDGTTVAQLWKGTLASSEMLILNEAGTVFLYDASGAVRSGTGPGRLVKTTVLTSGTSFTTQPTTNQINIKLIGGGGGGGGCTSVASAASAGGGGAAGAYAEKLFAVAPNTAYTYAIGAAGTGASGAAGNNGGSSTFTVGATTVTAPGGNGAPVATAVTTLSIYRGGTAASVATNGDVNDGGEPGGSRVIVVVATPVGASGAGGSTIYGAGGSSISAVGTGSAGTGYGAGGGGAMTGASTVRTGGSGTAGVCIVDEYT